MLIWDLGEHDNLYYHHSAINYLDFNNQKIAWRQKTPLDSGKRAYVLVYGYADDFPYQDRFEIDILKITLIPKDEQEQIKELLKGKTEGVINFW